MIMFCLTSKIFLFHSIYYYNKYFSLDEVFASGYFISLFCSDYTCITCCTCVSIYHSQKIVLRWLGEQYGFDYLHSTDGEASFDVSITNEVAQFRLLWASVFFHPHRYMFNSSEWSISFSLWHFTQKVLILSMLLYLKKYDHLYINYYSTSLGEAPLAMTTQAWMGRSA